MNFLFNPPPNDSVDITVKLNIAVLFIFFSCNIPHQPSKEVSGILALNVSVTTADINRSCNNVEIHSDERSANEVSDLKNRLQHYCKAPKNTLSELLLSQQGPRENTDYSDTEDEDQSKDQAVEALPKRSRANRLVNPGNKLALPIHNYTKILTEKKRLKVNNYILSHEHTPTAQGLARDALQIAALSLGGLVHTTILCVALVNGEKRVKKFAFHNKEEEKGSELGEFSLRKAHELGYHVIKSSERSHAEGQFLQFLYQRQKKKPNSYTHIVGMGCSRSHCPECDFLLKLVLGEAYKKVSAVIKLKDPEKAYVKLNEIPTGPDVLTTERSFFIITGEVNELCSQVKSNNFYISELLGQLIEDHIGIPIHISGKRYREAKRR